MDKISKLTSKKPLFKKKRKTEKGWVWEYDEKTIKDREREKSSKRKNLEKNIEKLRKQYKKDLSADDLRARAIAAVVSIMDATAMRIGNEDSTKMENPTFGATTLKKKHLTFSGSKIKLNFVGKDGVKQSQEVSDAKTIKVLKELVKDKKSNDFVFEVDGKKIWDRAVNRYLLPFKISAKDIRGFQANRIMKEKLKKKDYSDALKETAKEVGHEASTLEKNYLDPALVKKHKKTSATKTALKEEYRPLVEQLEQKYRGQVGMVSPTGIKILELSDKNKRALNIFTGVKVSELVMKAWKELMPFLPHSAKMTSGFRSADDQKRILRNYWHRATGQSVPKEKWNDIEMWKQISYKLRKDYGIIVGPPVWNPKKKYSHSRGNAFDISGADLDEIARAVERASSQSKQIKMYSQIERENNAVHVNVGQIEATALYDANIFIKEAYEDLLLSDPPIDILIEFEKRFDLTKSAGKYEEEKSDPKWNDVLIDKDGTKKTRKQIRDHYLKYAGKILKDINGKDVLIYVAPSKNQSVLKRKHNDKSIRINNKEDLMYWADRRLLSIHKVFGPKNKNGVIDLDPHGDFSKDKMIKFANKIKSLLKSKLGVNAEIWESGGSGLHLEFMFKEEKSVNEIRVKLKDICAEAAEDYDEITTGLVKGTGLRCDTSIYHNKGSIRAKWSLGENTGEIKKPLGSNKTALLSVRAEQKWNEKVKDIAFNSPDVFLSDYAEEYPEFQRIAVYSLAHSSPVSYFAIYKLYKNLEYNQITRVALYNLLATRPDIYFSQLLYQDDRFKDFHRLASYYAANITPKFFLDVLLKIMPEHQEFQDIAERKLKSISKRAGILDYPPRLYKDIIGWMDETIINMADQWMINFKIPKAECKEFSINLSGLKIYERYKDDIDALQKSGLYENITICIEPQKHKTMEASYNDNMGQPKITLFGFPQYLSKGFSQQSQEYYLDEAHYALRHELTHLSQLVLDSAVGKEAGTLAGLPQKSIRDDETNDIEFYPIIQNLMGQLKKILYVPFSLNQEESWFIQDNMPSVINDIGKIDFSALSKDQKDKLLKNRFRIFINESSYIKNLATQPEKYNKLLRELYRVFDQMTKTAQSNIYGWWLSPDGVLYSVEEMGHAKFVWHHPELFEDFDDVKMIPDDILKKGWLRLVNRRGTISIDLPQKDDKYIRQIQNASLPRVRFIDIAWPGGWMADIPYSVFMGANDFRDLERVKRASISKQGAVYGWWIAPDNTLYEMDRMGDHLKFVHDNPDLFEGLSFFGDSYDIAFDKDWIRATNDRSELIFELPSKDDKYIKRIQGLLSKLPIKKKIRLWWRGDKHNPGLVVPYANLTGAWGFKDLEKTASISKRADEPYGWWLSPDGRLYEVGLYGHVPFVASHPEIFGAVDIDDEYKPALDLGWIRVVVGNERLSFDIPDKDDRYVQRIQKVLPNLPRKRFIEIYPVGAAQTTVVPYSLFIAAYGFRDLDRMKVAFLSKRAQPEIKLDETEKKIFDLLNEIVDYYKLNVELLVVGGWPRDKLSGRESHDIDILVGGKMSGVDFAEYVSKYIRDVLKEPSKVGIIKENPEQSKHLAVGTINDVFGESLDFVSPRSEVYHEGSRIPEVKPATINEDLSERRDLTINSLAYNIKTGEIKDATGKGLEDLKNGIIRTPVDPKKTFMDDPLRTIRAIRFASRFGFDLAPDLIEAAQDPKIQEALRNKVSRERIQIELKKMLQGPDPVKAMELIKDLGLRGEVFQLPESYEEWEMDQNNPHHHYHVWGHTLEVLSNIQEIIKNRNLSDADKFILNMSALLHDVGKLNPEIKGTKEFEGEIRNTYHGHEEESMRTAEFLLRSLPGTTIAEIERIKKMIDATRRVNINHCPTDKKCSMTLKALGKFVRKMGDDWELAIDFAMADAGGHLKDQMKTMPRTYFETMKERIREMGPEQTQSMRPILSGNDLMALFGRKGGPWLGMLNKELIDEQIGNPSMTKEQAIEFAKRVYQKRGLDKIANRLSVREAAYSKSDINKIIDLVFSSNIDPYEYVKYIPKWEGELKRLSEYSQPFSKRAVSDKAGIFIVLPENIAKQFPSLGEMDSSPVHITTLFIGRVPKKHYKLIENAVKGVVYDQEPFDVLLDNKPTYFPATKHSDGRKVAKMKVLSPDLHKLHKRLKNALKEAGIEIQDNFPKYNPHITIEYMEPPKNKWEGEAPKGSFSVKEIEIWGCGPKIIIPFKKSLSKRSK